MQIPVIQKVLAANDLIAEELRAQFENAGLFVVNLLGSPGAGKTSLLERTLERAGGMKMGVIEGDLATSLDADRIARFGVPVVQINTGGGCHLDAAMVRKALGSLDASGLDVLLIENVGNLICPAEFDLGEACKAVVCSLPEGDDKVLKYPAIFSLASAVVLNKLDLLNYLNFNLPDFRRHLAELNPDAALVELSCLTGEGLDRWIEWLKLGARKAREPGGGSRSPAQCRE